MSITHSIVVALTDLISTLGYPGILILMTMESMVFPIPSEAVMPFAGVLISQGKMSVIPVLLASSLGSLMGSILSYYIGQKGGRSFIHRYGKYFLLNNHDLEITEKFFNKQGDKTIFISRFIPVIRHLISLPAGIGNMNKKKFLLFTFLGSTMWNMFLVWAGFYFGTRLNHLEKYKSFVDIAIVLGLGIILIYWFYKKRKNKK